MNLELYAIIMLDVLFCSFRAFILVVSAVKYTILLDYSVVYSIYG